MNTWSTWRKRISTLCRNNSGSTAVEVGITMLPFLLVVFAVAEFGWFFLHTHTMNSAVSQGIRVGTTGAVLDDGSGTNTNLDRQESIKQAIVDQAATVMVIDRTDIKIFPVNADWTDPNDAAVNADNAGGAAGAFMRVRVLYDHQFFTHLVGGFFGGGTGAVQMTSEGTYRNENFILGGS